MTIREAAKMWGLEERRLTLLCREGRIPGARKEGKLWTLPQQAEKPLDGRTREHAQQRAEMNEGGSAGEIFRGRYRREPDGVAFTPYRICPIGAHSDHNLGAVTGFAIDKGVRIVYGAKHNGVVEVTSLQFSKRAQWFVGQVPYPKQNDWADYIRGANYCLAKRHPLQMGLCAVIEGEFPIGGLSSSAAVIISFIKALCDVNDIVLSDRELILCALEAENAYVGVSCGKLDQSCEVYCRRDHMLYLDTKDDSYELIPQSPAAKPYHIAIFFSGLERSLAGSKFNMRVDEAKSAAYALMAFSGMEYGKYNEAVLRDVPYETYLEYRDRLPETWRKRAEHWYTEQIRVQQGREAFRRGDIETYGRLCFESGMSSIRNWETGSPELVRMYGILRETDGVYGARFSGAGFKGCCMALIDPAYEEEIRRRVKEEYLSSFPALADKYVDAICRTADGVGL